MRIKAINIYKFHELSKEAQHSAVNCLSDINVDGEWWEFTYEDAERARIKITEFDDYRIKGELTDTAESSIKAILENHGKDCETYKTAISFKAQFDALTEDQEDEHEELETEYLQSILEDYRIMLKQEYEYQTTEEAIVATIEANEYEFTENGKLTR